MENANGTQFALAWLAVAFMIHPLLGTVGVERVQMGLESNSCPNCHNLADVIPEGHTRDDVETVESCLNCHSTESPPVALGWIVHWKHYASDAFPGDCGSCHGSEEGWRIELVGTDGGEEAEVARDMVERMRSFIKSWARSSYLDRVHGQQRTDCLDCHSSYFPDGPASMGVCMDCHGSYPSLAELTSDAEPNPHASHVGEIDCGHCHKMHEESVLVCDQCHNHNLEVPESSP